MEPKNGEGITSTPQLPSVVSTTSCIGFNGVGRATGGRMSGRTCGGCGRNGQASVDIY